LIETKKEFRVKKGISGESAKKATPMFRIAAYIRRRRPDSKSDRQLFEIIRLYVLQVAYFLPHSATYTQPISAVCKASTF
jgi:hypothetical protein